MTPCVTSGLLLRRREIEHFEIASYGSVRDWAMLLGETDHAILLQTSLNEEKNADKVLTAISQQRNPEAASSISAA